MLSFYGKDSQQLRIWLQERRLFEQLEAQVLLPLFPLPDNFTAPTRTPWGGTKILGTYKQGLLIREEKQYPVVGESWEISSDPAAPSELTFSLGSEQILVDFVQVLELFAEQILGAAVAQKFSGQNPLLVKLLDAVEPLSVQVHPSDDYANLKSDESGKPECWFVLEAQEGSGLYLGLQEGVSSTRLRQAIEQNEDVSRYLNFVPVNPGDFFIIEAGTIHSIGAGVTLLETQKIAPRKSGKTYRLWDWNRRYDKHGQKTPNGTPRELHIEDSFQVINFEGPRGQAFVAQSQPERRMLQQQGVSQETLLVENEHFAVTLLELFDRQPLPESCASNFHGLIPYEGTLKLSYQATTYAEIPQGQSVIIPASVQEYTVASEHARALKVYYPTQAEGSRQ